MNHDIVLQAIASIAPDVEPELADLDPDIDLWTELQLDSMDRLAVLSRLAEQTGVEIPERDSAGLTSVNAIAEYLVAAIA